MVDAEGVLKYMADRREWLVEILSRLVLAESPSTSPEAQAVPLTLLAERLEALGFEVRVLPGEMSGGHLLARTSLRQSGEPFRPQQLLLGHCDTVWPVGTLEGMPLVIEDNTMRGPGAYDMKAGLAQMVLALQAVKELDLPMRADPVVFINSDEEIGSIESRPHIVDLAQQVERVFVLEPALGLAGKLKTARKGVGRFEVTVHGRAAHAGLDPEKGVSAVLGLSYLIQELHALNDWENGLSVNVGRITGGIQPNVIAPHAHALVDVRAPTAPTARRLEETILNLQAPFPGLTVEISGGFGRPPLERTARNQRLWRTARDAGFRLGLDLEEGMAGGGSDGNYTSLYAPTLDGLGAVGDGAHARHEFVFIDKMIERAALLALLLVT